MFQIALFYLWGSAMGKYFYTLILVHSVHTLSIIYLSLSLSLSHTHTHTDIYIYTWAFLIHVSLNFNFVSSNYDGFLQYSENFFASLCNQLVKNMGSQLFFFYEMFPKFVLHNIYLQHDTIPRCLY